MPRGRHRHSPSLHRLLPPVAVGAAGLVFAGATWLICDPGFGDADTLVLRGLAAAAALTGVAGAVLARTWDRGAGRRVAELKARQASVEWRAEERQADLEGDLEESREMRTRLETKLHAKRAELARLRTEHAALLRRYAHAEAGRASALEGRRLLELESGEPARALTAGAADHRKASGAPTPLTYLQAKEALKHLKRNAERQQELRAEAEAEAEAEAAEAARAEAERVEAERAARRPGAAASPFVPAGGLPRQPRSGDSGRFDFFGAAKRDPRPSSGGAAAGAGREGEAAPAGPADRAKPEADAEAEPEPEAEPGPEPEAERAPETVAEPDPGPGADTGPVDGESDPSHESGPETGPAAHGPGVPAPSRTTAHHQAGKVIDLGQQDDAEALDITELRSAIS
ncbi:hypothetical protein DVA86_26870 [Streptomyces armeniacus]|uniref:Secreted protein n=1 Tax=Streptomyces armeniacus TaxID=83291 RepID=A0A345XVQ2_9ACTN|nr:hypothetical protein [Streptomyces armeniacus]AXK35718.1 hypothetical protein DVA86_26870 [Streptomyces armeniacus]